MKKKDFLILWVLAIGLWLLIMPLRGYHFLWAITAHSIAFAILTWWAKQPSYPSTCPSDYSITLSCKIYDSCLLYQ